MMSLKQIDLERADNDESNVSNFLSALHSNEVIINSDMTDAYLFLSMKQDYVISKESALVNEKKVLVYKFE